MRTISVRFDDYLANWIVNCAQQSRVSISEFTRNLLYAKMAKGQFDILSLKTNRANKQPLSSNYKTELGYIIFTAKLIEKFILTSQEQGEALRNTAFEEAKESLSQLNINNKNKEQKFCFNLEEEIYTWLVNESSRLQIVSSYLIRIIIENAYLEDQETINYQVSELNKNSMENQIIACKLLEALISHTISDGDDIIEQARYNAKETVSKLYRSSRSSMKV